MRYEAFQHLVRQGHLTVGRDVGPLPDFTHVRVAARLGGLRRSRLHGNPGTPEGRRLGGLRSVAKRQAAAAQGLPSDGFQLAKVIQQPEPSPLLAEFFGMLLGDGCILNPFQVGLYFNTETDAGYADVMEEAARSLFGVTPRRLTAADSRGGALIFSSKVFVDYLLRCGFTSGDKVTRQAGVPSWIVENQEYARRCMRGLMDTDGSVYAYGHHVAGRSYTHHALCFTNRSFPLLDFVDISLRANGYRPTRTGFRVYLYRRAEVHRYFADIGTQNPKHAQRYHSYVGPPPTEAGRGV